MGFSMGQVLSAPCILLGVYGIFYSLKKKEPVGWVSDDAIDEEDDNADELDDDADGDTSDEEAPNDDGDKGPAAEGSKKLFDKDVADEFAMSAEERRKLTRKASEDE